MIRHRMTRLLLLPLRFLFEIVLGLLVLLDELARPFYRPLIAWVARLRLMRRFEHWVAGHARFFILVLLAIPFAIAEPLKFGALVVIAKGHVKTGVIILALAYLVSFVVVERIYSAGRPKLMTYRWFAWGMEVLVRVRAAVLERVRASVVWRMLGAARERARALLSHLRTR